MPAPLEALKALLTGEPEVRSGERDALLEALLEASKQYILTVTYRDALPAALERVQADLALIRYNRLGMEGEQAHSEGSVSRSIGAEDVPQSLLTQIYAWRLTPDARRARRARAAI